MRIWRGTLTAVLAVVFVATTSEQSKFTLDVHTGRGQAGYDVGSGPGQGTQADARHTRHHGVHARAGTDGRGLEGSIVAAAYPSSRMSGLIFARNARSNVTSVSSPEAANAAR